MMSRGGVVRVARRRDDESVAADVTLASTAVAPTPKYTDIDDTSLALTFATRMVMVLPPKDVPEEGTAEMITGSTSQSTILIEKVSSAA
jgi:hypothetical protein